MADTEVRGSYRFGPFHLDVRERRLSRGGEVIPLRLKVFDALLVLVWGPLPDHLCLLKSPFLLRQLMLWPTMDTLLGDDVGAPVPSCPWLKGSF